MAPWWVADHAVSHLQKLVAMLSSERASFRREFLDINTIERHHSTGTFRASPRNEEFCEGDHWLTPVSCSYRRSMVMQSLRYIGPAITQKIGRVPPACG